MGADTGETSCSVKIPADLIAKLVNALVQAMIEWHEENEMDVDPMVCDAAILVSAKILTEEYNGMSGHGGMLQ